MASTGDITVAGNYQGNVRIHPYLATLVRWCASCLWSTATVIIHRLMRAQTPQVTAPKARVKEQKPRVAGKDHLDPEPKVECVILHEPSSPTLDVIFVHGLYGSLGNTWRQGDWRSKYKIHPNVVQLRNHSSAQSCDCHKQKREMKTPNDNLENEFKCKSNENSSKYETDVNERETYENLNERLKRVLTKDNSLITEKFYNKLLDDDNIGSDYETQAQFIQDFYRRTKNFDNVTKCSNDDKCDDLIECKCKINERECDIGCGCVCDNCYSSCWPRDWIKVDFPGARVISVNYTSDPYLWRPLWVKGTVRLRLHERAEQMMSQLLAMGVGQRPIIWVGHSKGGLFIKQIYCDAFEAHLKASKVNPDQTDQIDDEATTNRFKNNDDELDLNINDSINFNDVNNGIKTNRNIENDYRIDFINNSDNSSEQSVFILRRNDELNTFWNIYNETELLKSIEDVRLNINREPNETFNVIKMDCDDSIGENQLENNCDENDDFCGKARIVYVSGDDKELEEKAPLSLKDQEVLKRRASLWRSSAGFMFYSVPHRGSSLADIKTPITTRSIELLEISKDCPLVLSLQDRWLMASCPSRPVVRSLVETCKTLMSVLWLRIVSVDSADAGIGELCGVSVDHREICKPSSRKCLLYTQLTDLIHNALNKCKCS